MQSTGGASLSDAENTAAGERGGSVRRGRYVAVLVALTTLVVVLDQVTKLWAVRALAGSPPVEVLGPVLSLRYVRNPGAAFGLGSGMTLVLSLIAVGLVVVIVRTARKLHSMRWAVGLGLLLGGALGNLGDRIFRRPGFLRGEVVDFLALPYWPVFNVADMAIVSAATLLAVVSMTGRRIDGTREVRAGTPVEPAPADAPAEKPDDRRG